MRGRGAARGLPAGASLRIAHARTRNAYGSRLSVHVKRRCVSVSHVLPHSFQHSRGASQVWNSRVAFSWSFICKCTWRRFGVCVRPVSHANVHPKPRILAILSVRTRQRKPLRGACCCAGPAGPKNFCYTQGKRWEGSYKRVLWENGQLSHKTN